MGFLSKIRNRVKKQIQPSIGSIRTPDNFVPPPPPMDLDRIMRGPGLNPRNKFDGVFISKPKIIDRIPGKRPSSPRPRQTIEELLASRPGIKKVEKRGGFGFGLGEAIRRLNQQQGMRPQPISDRMPDQETLDKFRQMASRSNPFVRDMITDDGRMYAGGSPGLYKPGGRFYNPSARLQRPNFDMEQIRVARRDPSALESLPMGDMPMAQDLPEVSPVGMMPQMRMDGMQDMQPRMMMAEGDEVIDRSPEQELFSLQAQLENLQKQLRLDRSYNDDQAVINTSAEMSAIQRRMQEILNEGGRTISEKARRAIEAGKGSAISNLDREILKNSRPQLAGGGDFPDLTGDGKVTQADILKGRGVYAEGDEVIMEENEIDAMLGGMDSEEAGAMEDLEQMAPEMEMIDQLVTMVVQMIQQGASEEEVMMFLREQGLDDEDIGTVLQLVAEMAEAEAMPQDGIGAELEQLV